MCCLLCSTLNLCLWTLIGGGLPLGDRQAFLLFLQLLWCQVQNLSYLGVAYENLVFKMSRSSYPVFTSLCSH